MAIKKARVAYLPLPDKRWMQRSSLVTVVAISLALIVMSKTGNPAVANLRTQITDIATPVLNIAASPMNAVHDASAWMSEVAHLYQQNAASKNENIELLKWQEQAKTLQIENASLRELLNVVPSQHKSFITARIVSDFGGPYVHSALINGGKNNGISKDMAAISKGGLMGRVVDAGDSSARVLLLNDINSRVPVIVERTQEKSILAGNNTDMPTLSYLPGDIKLKVGDRVVTSGDGGVFPQGIPVGAISEIDGGNVKVQPYINATKVSFVSIVDYSFLILARKRLQLSFLSAIPALITLGLMVVYLAAKHVSGLNQFMPLLPVIPMFYWGMVQARDIPYWFVFILGMIMDAVTGLPLGITSLMLLMFLIALYTQRKYIHKEGFVIKWGFFGGILGLVFIFNWTVLTFFYSHLHSIGPAFMQWMLTVCCYPFLHKAFDAVYDYIHSRRWQILHGLR